MSNLLERAINCDDGDRAAKIIQDALGRPIASGALALSASGCRPRRASWADAHRSMR